MVFYIQSRFAQSDELEPHTCVNARKQSALSVVLLIVNTLSVILVIAIAIGGRYIELSYEITDLWSFSLILSVSENIIGFYTLHAGYQL